MNARAMTGWAGLAALLCLPLGAGCQQLTVADGGASEFSIVLGPDASPSEQWGAGELQHWLQEMTGARLPIIDDRGAPDEHEIIIGQNAHLAQLHVDIDFAALGTEGYVIKTVGPHLVIAGGKQRGTMYGIFGLLEDHLECHWFTPEVSSIPKRERLELPAIDETKVPVLEYREPFVIDCFDGDWCARNRVNSHASRLEEKHGDKIRYCGFVHTFNHLVPPGEYFDEHPEYFSLIGGERRADHSQLCCTNPDVIRIVTEKVRQLMRDNPDCFVFSVSQNDWHGYCQCDECTRIAEEEGSQIGPVLHLVNSVARAVRDEFPDKVVDTLAYQYTRKAPKNMRPEPNVVVRLCSIECCFSHPLATCDSSQNTAFRQDTADWAKVCNRLWVWDYATSFAHYLVPFPNLRVLDDNIRFYVENNVKGIFEQDNYTSLHGELSPLGGYMVAKFLWDPNYDEDRAMDEFLFGVYGPAAEPIRRYIDLLHDKVADDNIHMQIWQGPNAAYLTEEIMNQGDELWEQAEAAVADRPEVLNRVRIARLSLDYALLATAKQATTSPYRFEGQSYLADVDPRFQARIERFATVGEQNGLTSLSEGGASPRDFVDRARLKGGQFPVVTLSGDGLQARVIPALGGRIQWLSAGEDGPNLLSLGDPAAAGYPAGGGYCEALGGGAEGLGSAAQFTAEEVQRTDQASILKLTAEPEPGLRMTRTITVPVTGSTLRIASTLENTRENARPGGAKAELALDLGNTDEITAIMPAAGEAAVMSLSLPEDQAEKQWSFTGEQIAEGLTLVNHTTGKAIRLLPGGTELDRVWLRVNARTQALSLALQTAGDLPPGGTVSLTQELEVLSDLGELPQARHTGAKTHQALTVVTQDDQLPLGRYGDWCWIEKDPKAEDGFAVRFANNHIEWCVQWRYSPAQFEPDTQYDVYARVRVAKKGDGGHAFWAGIYDTNSGAGLGTVQPATAAIQDSEYHMYKLGTVTPAQGHYIWMGPQGNAENLDGVWLDYFELRAVK